jgi:hypothetical protein
MRCMAKCKLPQRRVTENPNNTGDSQLRNPTFLSNQLDEFLLMGKCTNQRSIERRQRQLVFSGNGDKVMVRDLVCGLHQIGPDNSILATQVIGDEVVSLVAQKTSKNA